MRSDGEEQKAQIQEIAIFSGAMISYYLMNVILSSFSLSTLM